VIALDVAGAMRVGAAGARDAVRVDAAAGLAVVADAIGEARDELAALACDELRRAAAVARADDPLADGLAAAERAVAARRGRVALAAVQRQRGQLAIAHAGAVRVYVLRRGGPEVASAAPRWAPSVRVGAATLTALTRDHGSVAAMVEQGLIPRAAGRAHPLRSRLTRAVGAGMRIERRGFAAVAGDRVVIVSNGVWERLEDDELAARLAGAASPTAACDAVIAALAGRDHAGVAALFVEPAARTTVPAVRAQLGAAPTLPHAIARFVERGERAAQTLAPIGDGARAGALDTAAGDTVGTALAGDALAPAASLGDAPAASLGDAPAASLGDAPAASLGDAPAAGLGDAHARDAALAARTAGARASTPLLDRLGRDLTAEARAGRLDAVSGRDAELTRLQLALLSRRKPNAIVVGEPGVGKTSLVEALAQATVAGALPAELAGLRIVEVAASALVGGAKLRGELEERVTQLIAEAEAAPRLVVFLDELHALLGAPGVADALKPALARGRLRVIGATTPAELEKVAADEALLRRFEVVRVDEPTAAAARVMLGAARGELEAHFGAAFLDEALDAAIELTVRHVPTRRLPDKAIDALEHAGARRMLAGTRAPIGRADVAAALAERLGLPREALEPDDARRLAAAGERLAAELVGQAAAIAHIAAALRVRRPRGPRASLLFVGPTGVGKTEAARVLADTLYGPGRLVRFDMSEYAQDHQIARLIGAPPGYVGHQRPGALVEALRTRPGGVILFDELEKAHPDAWALLLQILEEGQLTDGGGRTAHLGDAVVILTSNLTARAARPAGFVAADAGDDEPALRHQLRQHLPAELVGRIGAVVAFRAPDVAARRALVARRVARVFAGRGSLAAPAIAEVERLAAPRVADLEISPRELAVFVDDLAAHRAAQLGSVDTIRPNARLVLALAVVAAPPAAVERAAHAAQVALRYVAPHGAGTLAACSTVADALALAAPLGGVVDHGRVRHDPDGLRGPAVERAGQLAARLPPGTYLTDDAAAQLADRARLTRHPDPQLSLWRPT
jgi:ATP-dependent Clp protease ATP-binding subunit ClpC